MEITTFIQSHRDNALLERDYNAYRSQLTRQLLSIRKKLGIVTPNSKNQKYSKPAVTAEDIKRNHDYVHLALLTAERAYAHAMHMKQTHAEENPTKGITGSNRRHILSKLNRAQRWATELAALLADQANSGATDTDVLEASAYAFSLVGAEAFEKQAQGTKSSREGHDERWEKCLVSFSTARVIYAALLQHTSSEVFREMLADPIDPSIRYAAYQSSIPRTVSVPSVARRFFPREGNDLLARVQQLDPDALNDEGSKAASKAEGAAQVPNAITWRGRKASIVDASIGHALASVAAAEGGLSAFFSTCSPETTGKERATSYDDVLIASQDAADATRRAIEELEREGVDEGDARMQHLRVTSLAVNYDLIGWRIGRNRVLLGQDDGATFQDEKPKGPRWARKDGKEWHDRDEGRGKKLARLRERVALYDATLQSIDSIKALRGAVREADFVEELDGKRAYFQSLKCLNVAYSHTLLSNHANALALFARALDLAKRSLAALQSSSALQPPLAPPALLKLDISPAQLQSLNSLLQSLTSRYRALVTLHQLTSTASPAAKGSAPLVERPHDYPAQGADLANLVTHPPRLQPVPVKPLFFDVAWNYIDYPGRAKEVEPPAPQARAEQPREESPAPKKKGWGWFGRG